MNKPEQLLRETKKFVINSVQEYTNSSTCIISGFDSTIKQKCLIKTYQLSGNSTEEIKPEKLEEVNRIIQILKNNNNPNILQFQDSFQIENFIFVQFERPEKTLLDLIKEKKGDRIIKNNKNLFQICAQIANAMSYLHKQNCFLMDISPEYIFISENGNVKIFSNKFVGSDEKDTIYKSYVRSGRDGRYFLYSPEIVSQALNIWEAGIKRKEKYDVWALGILMLILLGQNEQVSLDLHKQGCIDSVIESLIIDSSLKILLKDDILNPNLQKRLTIQELLHFFNQDEQINLKKSECSSQAEEIKEIEEKDPINEKNDDIIERTKSVDSSEVKSLDGSEKSKEKKSKQSDKRRKKNSKKIEESDEEEEEEGEMRKLSRKNLKQKCSEKNKQKKEKKETNEDSKDVKNTEEEKKEEVKSVEPVIIDNLYLKQLTSRALSKTDLVSEIQKLKEHLERIPKDIEALKVIAKLYQKRGMIDQELTHYKQITELCPDDADIYFQMGKAYLGKNKEKEAIDCFHTCFEKNKKHIESIIKLAEYFIAKKEIKKAEEVALMGLKDNQNNSQILYLLGHIYKIQNILEEALAYFDLSLKVDSSNKQCQADRLQTFKKIKETEIQNLLKLIEIDAHNYKVLYKLGLAYKDKDMVDQAIETLEKSIYIYPNQSLVYLALGDCFVLKNNMKVAKAKYFQSLEINLKCPQTWSQLGSLYLQKKKYIKAIKAYMNSISFSETKSLDLQAKLCEIVKKQMDDCIKNLIKKTETADIHKMKKIIYTYQFTRELNVYSLKDQLQFEYSQCLLNMSSFYKFFHTLGLLYLAYKTPKAGILQLKKSLILNPLNKLCLVDLSSVFGIQNQDNQVIYYANQALLNYDQFKRNFLCFKEKRILKNIQKTMQVKIDEIENNSEQEYKLKSIAYYNIAYILESNFKLSYKFYTKSINLDSMNAESYYRIGLLFYNQNKLDQAIQYFQSCILIEKYHLESHEQLEKIYQILKDSQHQVYHSTMSRESKAYRKANYYLKNKDYQKSVDVLFEWEELNPTNPECQFYLSELMSLLGKKDSQIQYLKKCLELNPTHEQALKQIYELQNSVPNEQLAQGILSDDKKDEIVKLVQHIEWEYVQKDENELRDLLQQRQESFSSFKSGLYMKSKYDLNKAHFYFEEYTKQQPHDYLGFYLLGNIEEKKGNFENAEDLYKKSLQLKPDNNFNSNSRLGVVCFNLKKTEEALSYLKQAENLIQKDEKNCCSIAQCYNLLGKHEEAVEYFKMCEQINPSNEIYKFYIYQINTRRQNLDNTFTEMQEKAQAAYKACKDKNISLVMLQFLECIINEKEHKNNCSGFCLYQSSKLSIQYKKVDEAVELLKQSVKMNPNYPPLRLVLAQNLINQQKYDKAFEELEKILEQDSENYDGNYLMGVCRYNKNQFQNAYLQLMICDAQKPNVYEVLKLMGQSLKQNNETEKAIELFNKCLDINPNDVEVLILLAESYAKKGDIKQSIEVYQKALKLNTKDFQSLYQYAKILFEENLFPEAIQALQECIKINTTHEDAQNLLGLCYMKTGDTYKAITAFKKQGQINKAHKEVFLNLGKAYIKFDQVGDAITVLSKYMNQYPEVEETYELLNSCFGKQKQVKKQIKILQNLLEKYPKRIKLNLSIADIQYKEKLYQEAIESYKIYLKEFEGTKEIYYCLCMCYVRKNLLKESVEILNKSISLFPDMYEFNYHLAKVYLALGNQEESFKNIQQVLKQNPEHISGIFIEAQLYYLKSDYQNALERFEICLNTYDQLPELYFYLARCYKKLGMKDMCLPFYQAAIVRNPEDMNSKIELGFIYVKSKNYQKGLALLENYENFENILNFNDPKYYYYLAQAYYHLNQLTKAHKFYQKCFECPANKYSKISFSKIYKTMLKQKRFSEIKKNLSDYLKMYSKDPEIYFFLAEVYVLEGVEQENILEYTDKALEINPVYNECKVLKAYYYLNVEKDPKKVIQFLNEFEEQFINTNENALLVLSQANLQLGNIEKSQEYLTKLLLIDEKSENAIYQQGLLYVKTNKIDMAILEFEKNDQHDKSFYQLGLLQRKQQKYDQARASFTKAISFNPNDPQYYKVFGKLEYGQKEYTKACNYFSKYLQKATDPELLTLNLYAQSQYNCNNYKESIATCELCIEKNLKEKSIDIQQLSKSYQLVGLNYHQLKDYAKAGEFFKKSTDTDSQNSESFFWQGNIFKLQNDQQQAKQAYLTCISLKKDHTLCLNYLGEIYYKERDDKKAKKYFTESILYDTQSNPNSYVNLGKYFEKVEKNLQLAEDNYKKGLQIDKTNQRAAKRIAKIYILQNKYDEVDKVIIEYSVLFETNAPLLLLFGNFYFSKEKYDNAITQYEKCLLTQSNNEESKIKIIQSQFLKKQFTKCEEALKKYSKELENNFIYNFIYAQVLIQKQLDSRIVFSLKKCQQIQKDDQNSHYLQAYFLYEKGSKKFQENYNDAVKLNPSSNSELGLILKSIIHAQNNEDEEALKSFQTCLALYPRSELCLLNLGLYQLSKQKYENARDSLQKCINYDFVSLQSIYSKPLTKNDLLQVRLGLAFALKETKEVDKSFDLVKQCLTMDPNNPEVTKLHAIVLQLKGNLSSSIIQYQKYLQTNPDSYEVQFLLGKARLEIGCPDQAIYSLKKCLQLNPKYPKINGILAEAYELDLQYSEALIHYQKQIQIEPENTQILFKMALILISFDNFSIAKDIINKLIDLKPQDHLVYSAQGFLYKRQGEIQEAIKSFEQSLQIQPANTFTLFNLAVCYFELGNMKQEKKMYKEIQKINPNDKKMLNNLGNIYRQKGKYDKAIQLFTQCIKFDQYQCDYFTNLGLCYHAKGDYDAAINYFQKGYTLDRINVDCLLNLASSLKAKGEPQQAIKYLQKIIKINPNCVSAYYNLGILQKQNGNKVEAQNNFKLGIEKDSNHINSIIQLAILYREQNDYNNSKSLLKKALEIDQNNELANFNIALLYRQKCKYTKELNALLKSLSLSPKNAKYLHNIGICQRLQENYQEALIYFKQSVQIDSTNANYYYNLADIYNCLRMPNDEIACYQKCIQLHQNFEKAYYNLGIVYENVKNFQEALNCYEKCIEITPSNENYFFSLGNVHSQLGNLQKSNEYYQQSLLLNPNNIDCLNNLAINYIKLKQHQEAIKIYQKCLDISQSSHQEFKTKIHLINNYIHHQS